MLKQALEHPIWDSHVRNKSTYQMDFKKDNWEIVYYPIFECGKTGSIYDEPRALVRNLNKEGFWSKEVPLRYLKSSDLQNKIKRVS